MKRKRYGRQEHKRTLFPSLFRVSETAKVETTKRRINSLLIFLPTNRRAQRKAYDITAVHNGAVHRVMR